MPVLECNVSRALMQLRASINVQPVIQQVRHNFGEPVAHCYV